MTNALSPLVRRMRRSETGTTSIEFAIIGMLLIALTLGTFELGRVTYTYHRLTNAVGGLARVVEMGTVDIEENIRSRFPANERGLLEFEWEVTIVNGRLYFQVAVTYPFRLLMPGLGLFPGNRVNIRVVQVVPIPFT
jgi:hypothetical protein